MKEFMLMISFCAMAHMSCAQYQKFSFQQPEMGSLFSIVIYSRDSAGAARAASSTFRMIDSLNEVYSDYLPGSELNRLCQRSGMNEWTPVSPVLFGILREAIRAGALSQGSFDITMGPVIRLWRRARLEKKLPAEDSMRAARKLVSFRFIELDSVRKAVRLKRRGMRLDLGGIAKGETAQRACERLKQLGCPYALIDAGGDVVAGEVPEGIEGWHVSINLPESDELMRNRLLLRNKAVTTSGDLYQYVTINGKRYSHIVNPATGRALTNSRNVTVIADRGIDADWLTKACSILPVTTALRLVEKFHNAEVQIATLRNGKPIFYRSPGFTGYFQP